MKYMHTCTVIKNDKSKKEEMIEFMFSVWWSCVCMNVQDELFDLGK